MEHDFRFYFNRKNQWADVYLHNVHPTTFARENGGRWAYFLATWKNPRRGLFGELHFIERRLRFDVIVHELDHLRTEWMWAKGYTIDRQNEERMAEFLDSLTRNFLRELRKVEPEIRL